MMKLSPKALTSTLPVKVGSLLMSCVLLAASGCGVDGASPESEPPASEPPGGDEGEGALKPQGESCLQAQECQSALCVEGVCCDSACDGACDSCLAVNSGGRDGRCAPINAGTICRAEAGPCDLAEACDGVTASCPADVMRSDEVVCRAEAGGGCDVAETCSGDSPLCPDDGVKRDGEAGSPSCAGDLLCDGVSAACPERCERDEDCAGGLVCLLESCASQPSLSLSPQGAILSEGDATPVFFVVRSTSALSFDIDVDVEVEGSASLEDYSISTSRVTIPVGANSAGFNVSALPDQEIEPDETIIVTISTSTPGVVVGPEGSATITLRDDDEVVPPPPPPARDSLDWLSQDVVPGRPTQDPYCVPGARQEARINTPLGFIRTDAAGDEGGISVLVPTYNPERQRWEERVLTTFDFRPYAESQPGVDGIPNGADVFEGEGQYVSIVGTNDSGGVAGWASSWGDGCQYFDGWISYDRNNVPDFDPAERGSWASVRSPIQGVSNPTRDNCPGFFGSTFTRWTYVSDFVFAGQSACQGEMGPKVMDTIVSDHDGGDHHEVFYFTDEYGSKSRWERWECGIPYPDHDFITARCRYNESQSVMHMAYGINDDRRTIVNPNGDTCHMTDCRDFTSVEAVEGPGYKGAAWHYGAAIYFSGNILRNGDFHSGDEGWHSLGTTAQVRRAEDGNHFLHVSAPETGWHSVLGSSLDEFNRFFDADGEEAYRPKHLHWGARVRHAGGEGVARLALVEWGNPDGEIIDERLLALSPSWQWVEFHRLMGAATNGVDIRLRLDGMSGLEVDDVYIYISPDETR